MIYLIDDNFKRQNDSGWNEGKFEQYKDFIHPIYRLSEVNDELRNELFKSESNVILFHESFFENFENKQDNDVNDIRNKLEKISRMTLNRYYVIFSGSNSERKLDENNRSASIPVHVLYNNLEVFINHYQNKSDYNLKYLVYGLNIEIEPLLLENLNKSKRIFIEESTIISNELDDYFFFRSRLDFNPLNKNHTTIFNKDSEFGLHAKIIESLSNKLYKGIFIPLCFGNSLSDFNGLRLATEIRTTNTINQCTPIFILSFVRIEYLLQNEYFNILKTKGVELIDYSKGAIEFSTSKITHILTTSEITNEISKLELRPPKNYQDNHSIANEWAIIRWSKTLKSCGVIDQFPDEIELIEKKIESNLYYKYLTCKFPVDDTTGISKSDLKLKYNGRILYIDDESDKGWNELFCSLFWDGEINKIANYESLGPEFKGIESDKIIELSAKKAKYFDVVILDFRLTQNDFFEKDPKKITGFKILEKIKKLNKGIQVVIFSATNKVWNLQAIEEAGADGFIMKESPENSVDKEFTKESIKNIISTIDKCFKMSFLKTFSKLIDEIKSHFDENSPTIINEQTNQFENNYSRFQNEIMNQLTIAFDCLHNSKNNLINQEYNQKYLDLALVSIFKILELFNKEFIQNERLILKKYNGKNLEKDYPSTLDKTAYVIRNKLNMDLNGVVGNLVIYNDMRNDIIHPQKNSRQRKSIPADCVQFAQIIKQFVYKTE